MVTASIEVSGQDAERAARELQAALASAGGPTAESVSPIEVERSAELVIALVALVFSGIDAAGTIWGWWRARRPPGATVKILFEDGTQVDLSVMDQQQLALEFERRVKPQN